MRRAIPALIVSALLAAPALAKLPAPSDEAKLKAAEAAAKSAWQSKVGAYQLCRVEDRIAAKYRKSSTAAKPDGGASAAMAAASAAPMAASGAAATTQLAAADVKIAPCVDPGPYVAAAGAEPLEAAGAHSPAKTAVGAPSSNATAAELQGTRKK